MEIIEAVNTKRGVNIKAFSYVLLYFHVVNPFCHIIWPIYKQPIGRLTCFNPHAQFVSLLRWLYITYVVWRVLASNAGQDEWRPIFSSLFSSFLFDCAATAAIMAAIERLFLNRRAIIRSTHLRDSTTPRAQPHHQIVGI